MPSRADLLRYVREQQGPTTPRDVARAFGLRGEQRAELRRLLRTLEDEGAIVRDHGRRLRPIDGLPAVGVIEVTGTDEDGEATARPTSWPEDGGPPPAIIVRSGRRLAAVGVGERLLARLRRCADGTYEAQPMRRLPPPRDRLLGVLRRRADGAWLEPVQRGARAELPVVGGDDSGAGDGDLVHAEPVPGRRRGRQGVRIIECLGAAEAAGGISRIAIHEAGIPHVFSDATLRQAAALRSATADGRVDLRDVPLVTIDGDDARDFDDAVFAEPAADAASPGGWHIIVAIADVAAYVRPGDAIDREARQRGNSVYFPDLVVPMLPEALSNDLCSLKPREERPCLACHLWIDDDGQLKGYRFERARMRSAARLTYTQVQAARDGRPDEQTAALMAPVLAPLYAAHAGLEAARRRRGVLELDLPERRVVFGPDGEVAHIGPQPRYASHRLIEDFMITANVAAARALEEARQPCMYRVHEPPDPGRVDDLREALASVGVTLSRGLAPRPQHFNRALEKVAGQPHAPLIGQLVLRTQSQAVYSPDNAGHFGLGLRRYAHFTSPIRRYADLLVHRALIDGMGLGDDGLPADAADTFAALGTAISSAERRAAAAERSALNRYAAAFLSGRVGATFAGFISGVSRAGLFVTLVEVGADGLVPASRLPRDDYRRDDAGTGLIGRFHVFRVGEAVEVRLAEARAVSGAIVLDLLAGGSAAAGERIRRRGGSPNGKKRRGRPRRRR